VYLQVLHSIFFLIYSLTVNIIWSSRFLVYRRSWKCSPTSSKLERLPSKLYGKNLLASIFYAFIILLTTGARDFPQFWICVCRRFVSDSNFFDELVAQAKQHSDHRRGNSPLFAAKLLICVGSAHIVPTRYWFADVGNTLAVYIRSFGSLNNICTVKTYTRLLSEHNHVEKSPLNFSKDLGSKAVLKSSHDRAVRNKIMNCYQKFWIFCQSRRNP
jgi:hypothetical protein